MDLYIESRKMEYNIEVEQTTSFDMTRSRKHCLYEYLKSYGVDVQIKSSNYIIMHHPFSKSNS